MYNELNQEIVDKIKKVCAKVYTGDDINPDYAKDEMPIYGTRMPGLAAVPTSTEEVAAIVKICYENNTCYSKRCRNRSCRRCSAALRRSTDRSYKDE